MRRTLFSLMLLGSLMLSLLAVRPTQAQQEALPPGGFVEVSGSQLVRVGQPVQLLGSYYEPQNYTPLEMWLYWDSTRIAHDLQLARQHMGTNVVWIKLPYTLHRNVADDGLIQEELITRLREVLQIVGALDMRVIITLFDGYSTFPTPGRFSEEKNITYLYHLVGSFAGDERILGWDIYYKPDRNHKWRDGASQQVLSWLVRMANHVQQYAPHQLVIVTMDDYTNLWEPDFDGHIIYDYVDIIMLRGSDTEDIIEDVADIRTRSGKPIVLYDYAHASGPPCRDSKYTPERQASEHAELLQHVLAEGHVSGIMMRELLDINSGPLEAWDEKTFHEGFFDIDYQPRPAAAVLQAYGAPPLPNVTTSNLPLRALSYKPPYLFDEALMLDGEPRPIEGTDHFVKFDMRRAWDTFGGRHSLGLPLTEAYKRAEDNRVVQYFEAGVLVLYPEARNEESYAEKGPLERLKDRVRVAYTGLEYTQGRVFPPPDGEKDGRRFHETGHYVEGEFLRFYERANGDWRLGNPISERFMEEVNGTPTMVQYFEKGRLEVDPATGLPRFGQLGAWRFQVQCQNMP